ncbi:MAG TPA: AEC family transporter [Bacteroidia bacterium]|nr:AEC family transporter [Bacteroidia bacterium]HRS57631.1 AEC family transporter [Bacteroidia bacterium]HRU68918.1 AEC family transporter [Bacteroidia bacterium]
MAEMLQNILPVYLIFFSGLILRWTHVLSQTDGERMLKFIFYFTLPALVLKTLSGIQLIPALFWLPFASAVIILLSGILAYYFSRLSGLSASKSGVLLTSSMIMNIGFTIPFVHAVWGEKGLGYLFMFDFSNGIMAYSVVYYIACRHGENAGNSGKIYKKVFTSPPIWALLIALTLNISNIQLPYALLSFLDFSGQMTIPLFLIALSLFFAPSFSDFRDLLTGISLRMGFGFLLGLLMIAILPLDPLAKIILITGASSPVGFNTLTFASLEKLDTRYAANLVSFSILLGMVLVPLLLLFWR